MKKLVLLGLLIPSILYAQTSGTPSQIRVLTDANNYLLVSAAAQTLPLSQPTVFTNTRLRTDSNNYLQVVLVGGITPTFPILAPVGNCTTAPPYSFSGDTNTGMGSPSADIICFDTGGVNRAEITTTALTSILPLLINSAGFGTPLTMLEVDDTSTSVPRGILNVQYSTDTNSARFNAWKARGTKASPTTVVTGDVLGNFASSGYDGSNYIESASFRVTSTGTIAATRVPTYASIFTGTDAAPTVLTEALRATAAQVVNVISLGFGSVSSPNVFLFSEGSNYLIQRNGSSAQRFSVANTYTSSTTNELFSIDWQTTANTAIVGTRTVATGSGRTVLFASQADSGANNYAAIGINRSSSPFIRIGATDATGSFSSQDTSASNWVQFVGLRSVSTSGTTSPVSILPVYNQASGNAANTDLLINRTQTAVGSGAQRLIDAQVGGTSMFSISNTGILTTAATTFMHSTSAALANGAGAQAGTLLNAPTAGNPTKWIPINDNGTTRYIPAW